MAALLSCTPSRRVCSPSLPSSFMMIPVLLGATPWSSTGNLASRKDYKVSHLRRCGQMLPAAHAMSMGLVLT
eukprot:3759505-Rhodomonas_salina.1